MPGKFDTKQNKKFHYLKILFFSSKDLNIVSYHDSGVIASIRKSKTPLPLTNQNLNRTVKKNNFDIFKKKKKKRKKEEEINFKFFLK